MQNHRFNRLFATGAISLAGLGLVAALPAASASAAPSSVDINRHWGTSVANIQVQREDTGGLSVDFGVDMANHSAGVPWKVTITRNGKLVASTTARTIADGSFSITRVLTPVPGTNAFVAHAVNTLTGQAWSISGTL
jgi:hypothetical protein